ncbi:cytochrome P450 [Annulohypoxylon truncatum]|uniref:cytochrome P450 n=1 Tax=Annulohypoxylon truncatum TaxID=327061 RepID=UPI002008421C|nr:cytochrome P450 [Annulohypoxylon truncatum]KAI1209292.1 cytochrome P450 [Annulohypoxylon truncatum]
MHHNIPADDIPRTEVGNIFAITGNTGPAAFWIIYHLYSNPSALESCRDEVSNIIQEDGSIALPWHRDLCSHDSRRPYARRQGGNVDEFYHEHFIRSTHQKRPNPVAFRGFGGGTGLCPGRHFASTEILAFAALMITRFDVRPIGGKWNRPGTDKAALSASVAPPNVDFEVEITPKSIYEWRISCMGSDKAMEIAAEDIVSEK